MTPNIFLLLMVGSVILVAVVTVIAFRFATRWLGVSELVEEGVVLSDEGLEVPRLLWLGKIKIGYDEVESVELLPYYKALTAVFRYGLSVSSNFTRHFHEAVVIRLKKPRGLCQYFLVTPKNAAGVFHELRTRIAGQRISTDTKS